MARASVRYLGETEFDAQGVAVRDTIVEEPLDTFALDELRGEQGLGCSAADSIDPDLPESLS